jgi:hypothetical protein
MTRRVRPLLALSAASALALLVAALGGRSAGQAQPGQAAGADKPQPAGPAVTSGKATTIRPTARQPLRVAIYGDSLAWEARQAFVDAITAKGRAVVLARVFGGTAICDWLARMRADARGWHPQAVVVEFSGDAFTPCMRGPGGEPFNPAAQDATYARDARQVVSIFSTTAARLYFAGYPISRGDQTSATAEWNYRNTLYATLAARTARTEFIDAGQAVEDRGHYTDSLPCLTGEPCTGSIGAVGHQQNVVRAPDGVHFCPNGQEAVNGVTVPCTVWSSGAFRYGKAMAAPVLTEFGI